MDDLRDSPLDAALASGRINVTQPLPRWNNGVKLWRVVVRDNETGEFFEKHFAAQSAADSYLAELYGQVARIRSTTHRGGSTTQHRPPSCLDDDDDGSPAVMLPVTSQAASGDGMAASRTGGGARKPFQVRPVRDALAAAGLDPIAELARIVSAQRPVIDKKTNEPMLDADGEVVMTHVLDPDTRGRLCAELAQYVSPKLKSVEVRQDTGPPKTVDQIDREIAMLVSRRND